FAEGIEHAEQFSELERAGLGQRREPVARQVEREHAREALAEFEEGLVEAVGRAAEAVHQNNWTGIRGTFSLAPERVVVHRVPARARKSSPFCKTTVLKRGLNTLPNPTSIMPWVGYGRCPRSARKPLVALALISATISASWCSACSRSLTMRLFCADSALTSA